MRVLYLSPGELASQSPCVHGRQVRLVSSDNGCMTKDTLPVDGQQPSSLRAIAHAREACLEVFSDLTRMQHDLDVSDFRPDYWLGTLQGITGYLLWALEDAEAGDAP
jgi:hypothetical protein